MVAIAIFSTDPDLRRRLEPALREDPAITVAGVANDPAAVLRLIAQDRVDVVVADAPPLARFAEWRMRHGRTFIVVLLEETGPEDAIEALAAGAAAILPRAAAGAEIIAAIKAVRHGLAALPHDTLATLLEELAPAEEPAHGNAGARLTPRELEVLAAMADGASNKAIARRLDISFHTAKFHVAAILAKLDADTRTEAVTRAAQLGLVML
jgi:DNA-binding NarL/FixJ family response regulator